MALSCACFFILCVSRRLTRKHWPRFVLNFCEIDPASGVGVQCRFFLGRRDVDALLQQIEEALSMSHEHLFGATQLIHRTTTDGLPSRLPSFQFARY